MRKRFLLPLLVLLLTTLSTHAYDFQSGDLYYNITSETTVEVTYQIYCISCNNYPDLTTATIPATVTYNGTTYSVTGIGDNSFYECSSLISITIPNSVTNIGDYAFYRCSSLTSIDIPETITSIGKNAFSSCSSLISVTIPNSVISIGDYAFSGVPNIVYNGEATGSPWGARSVNGYVDGYLVYADNTKTTLLGCCMAATGEITIPNSVTSIGEGAFYGCSSLTSITLPESVTSIGSSTFSGCSALTSITIPNSVTSIGRWAFSDCSSLTSITIPNSVTNIGKSAFTDCTSLASITIPNSVTSIGEYAFRRCNSLTSVTLSNSLTSIENDVFEGCSSLTSITIPNSVKIIGDEAFSQCSSLTSVTIPNSVTSIEYEAFSQCSSITSITIPNSVTSIGGDAFYNVANIMYSGTATGSPWGAKSVNGYVEGYLVYENDAKTKIVACSAAATGEITIPISVTDFGEGAFYGCSSITSVVWNPKHCTATSWKTESYMETRYYYGPFANISTKITSFTIGEDVDSIPDYLCYGMKNLTSVISLACTPPVCGYKVFYNTPGNKTLRVPSSSLDSYKNSSTWENFTSFGKCLSVFVHSSDSTLGIAQIDQDVDCDSMAIISATCNLFTHQFTQWSDGNTDNPRTIKLTQDTTLIAEFGLAYSGKCGDNLYWAYSNKEVKITGSGAMYNYTDSTMPWTLLRDSIKTVRVGNNATSIGEYAFANTPKLAELHIGANVEDIGANAFTGCKRLYQIYSYPTYPPFAKTSSFATYNAYLYISCENSFDYEFDEVWGLFTHRECIGSEDVVVTDDEVVVAPSYEDVTITWPVVSGADTYSLVLTKEGDTFCTLVFNAQGQLVSIAFKPARQNAPAEEGTTPATYAEMTANGFRFTVTGLDEGTDYAYTLTVRNASNSVLETYTGEFTTLSNTPTGISDRPDTTETVSDKGAEKLLHDGQVLIIRNGETYDMMGQRL